MGLSKYTRTVQKYSRLGNMRSLFSAFNPLIRLGRKIWPYIRVGLPLLVFIAFITLNVLILWKGPLWHWGGEYPLTTWTSRILACLVITFFILVLIIFYQRHEVRKYYRDKHVDDMEANDPVTQYIQRQTRELDKIITHIEANFYNENYLYELPWYLLVGLNESGKTSLINRSDQEFLFSTVLKASDFNSQTPYKFNWWINDDAIFIDPDSELLLQVSMDEFEDEENPINVTRPLWLAFLDWLIQKRTQRPLNGIILTIDTAYVVHSNEANRQVYAGILRARIREIMETLTSRLPVYVVFTKLDLFSGFTSFFKNTSIEDRKKILGFTFNIATSQSADLWLQEFENEYLDLVVRLNEQLPRQILETRNETERGTLYSFVQQMAGMEKILYRFIKTVLTNDKFSTTPIVRGVYFTSTYQQGVPNNIFINTAAKRYDLMPSLSPAQNMLSSAAYFTGDLFHKIIFAEAGLATDNFRIQETKRRRLINTALISAIGALFFVMIFHYFYSKNASTLVDVKSGIDQFNEHDIMEYLDRTGKIMEEPLNLIRNTRFAFGDYDNKSILADIGYYLGGKVGPKVEEAYLELLAYRYLPALLSGVADDLENAEGGSDEQLEFLRLFNMLINKKIRQPEIILDYFSQYWQGLFAGDAELQKNLIDHLEYALENTDLLYERGINNPSAERALVPYDNLILKSKKDLAPMPMEHRVYRSFKQRGLSFLNPALDLRLVVGPAFDIIFDLEEERVKEVIIPQLFTKRGIEKYYYPQYDKISELVLIDNWVIGQRDTWEFSQKDLNFFNEEIREQYGRDYKLYWKNALETLQLKQFDDINHAVLVLNSIVDTTLPLQRILISLKENTNTQPTIPEADITEDSSVNQKLKVKSVNKLFSDISRGFTELNGLIETREISEGKMIPPYMDEVILAIQNINETLKQIQSSRSSGEVALKFAKDRIKMAENGDPIYTLNRISERLPSPMNKIVASISDQSWNVILKEAIKQINIIWVNDVYKEYNTFLANKYPFNVHSKEDVTLEEFERFFGKEGTIASFYENELKMFLDESLFSKHGQTYRSVVKEEVIAQIELARMIEQAFFNRRGVLGLEYTAIPLMMGPQVQRSVLNIEGQYVEYTHGPRRSYALIWPNTLQRSKQDNVVKISMIGSNVSSQHSTATYTGPWALFRLLDDAQVTIIDKKNINVTLSVNNIPVQYQIIAQGDINPFTISLLHTFRLSPSLY